MDGKLLDGVKAFQRYGKECIKMKEKDGESNDCVCGLFHMSSQGTGMNCGIVEMVNAAP